MKNKEKSKVLIYGLSTCLAILVLAALMQTSGNDKITEHSSADTALDTRLNACGDILGFTTQQYRPHSNKKTPEQVLMDIYYHAKAVFGENYCSCYGDPAMGLLAQAGIDGSGKNASYTIGKKLEVLLLKRNATMGGDIAHLLERYQKQGAERDTRFDRMLSVLQEYLGGTATQRYNKVNTGKFNDGKVIYDPLTYNFDFIDIVEIFENELEQQTINSFGTNGLIHPWGGSAYTTDAELYNHNRLSRDQVLFTNLKEFGLEGFRGVDKDEINWRTPTGIDYTKYYKENDYRNLFAMPWYSWDLFDEYLQSVGYKPPHGAILNQGFLTEVISAGKETGGKTLLQDMRHEFKCHIYDKAKYAKQSGIQSLQKKYGIFNVDEGKYSCPNSPYRTSPAQPQSPVPVKEKPIVNDPIVSPTPVKYVPEPIVKKPIIKDPIREDPVTDVPEKRIPGDTGSTSGPAIIQLPSSTKNPYSVVNTKDSPSLQTQPSANPYIQFIGN